MDKKTQKLLLIAGAGAAAYYFFFMKKKTEPISSSFMNVGGTTGEKAEEGCWVITKMAGSSQTTEPRWESPCPYGQTSSFDKGFSSAAGDSDGGCWVEVIDPSTGGMSTMYEKPCRKNLPKGKGGKGDGRPAPRRKRKK